MSTLSKRDQTLTNFAIDFLQLLLPTSTASLIDKGSSFSYLNRLTIYLTETVLKEAGKHITFDTGGPWFLPNEHPHIYAVRKQVDGTFTAWQVREPHENTLTIVTFSDNGKALGRKQHLNIKISLDDLETQQSTSTAHSLELKYPKTPGGSFILGHTYSVDQYMLNNPQKKENLAYKYDEKDLHEVRAEFWTCNPDEPLFG